MNRYSIVKCYNTRTTMYQTNTRSIYATMGIDMERRDAIFEQLCPINVRKTRNFRRMGVILDWTIDVWALFSCHIHITHFALRCYNFCNNVWFIIASNAKSSIGMYFMVKYCRFGIKVLPILASIYSVLDKNNINQICCFYRNSWKNITMQLSKRVIHKYFPDDSSRNHVAMLSSH